MDINSFLKASWRFRSQKQNVKDTGYSINNVLQHIIPYSKYYNFKSENAKNICILMMHCFGENIFNTLPKVTGADMFSNIYFPVILDNNYDSILMSTNSIVINESDKDLCSKI